jgi:hypothetical protein
MKFRGMFFGVEEFTYTNNHSLSKNGTGKVMRNMVADYATGLVYIAPAEPKTNL